MSGHCRRDSRIRVCSLFPLGKLAGKTQYLNKGLFLAARQPSRINRPLVRILVIWVIQTPALIILAFLLDDLDVDRLGNAMLAVVVIGLINAVF